MLLSQSAIVADPSPFALFVLFNVTGSYSAVARQCSLLHALVNEVNENQPGANIKAALSFSPSFCQKMKIETPTDFVDFQALGEGDTHAPATQCDFFLHLHSNRVDLNFYLLRKWISPIAMELNILDETYGYRFFDSRDMTGFIDGTENPQGDEARRHVALVPDGPAAGGSFVLLQRYVHKLASWEAMSVSKQEEVIGRTKPDSIEREENAPTSHLGRVDLKENGEGLKILRHSMPYGSVSNDHGLLFIAYCHRQYEFHTLLKSMYGERDGKKDHLLQFTHPVTGAFFFAPSVGVLEALR